MTQSAQQPPKKGRPTPKRSEAAQKRQTLAPIKGRENKKRAREDAKAARIAARAAYMRGAEQVTAARRRALEQSNHELEDKVAVRTAELARMLGGQEDSATAAAHAEELLALAADRLAAGRSRGRGRTR